MAIQLDAVTRNSGIDPLVEPINCTIDYSGASTTTQLRFSGFFGTVLDTGGAGSGSVTADIPSPNDAASINAAGLGGAGGWTVSDSGVSGDGVSMNVIPFWPSMTAVTELSTYVWDFGPAAYDDFHNLVGGGPISAPYDYWFGDPGAVDTWSLSRVFGGTSRWTASLPYSSLEWDFGDGSTSTSSNPTHTYTNPGAYEITLTVDYDPFLVPLSMLGRSGPTTITLSDNIFIELTTGWLVGRVGVGI